MENNIKDMYLKEKMDSVMKRVIDLYVRLANRIKIASCFCGSNNFMKSSKRIDLNIGGCFYKK